jgi:glutamate racemase
MKTMDTRPIGIFDSGVGGLSVLREIKKLLPRENYIFIADQKNIPYGGKTPAQIRLLASRVVKYFIGKRVKMVVVACNTATCYAIEFLRKKYPSVTFVGTVPAIKPAARLSHNKSIAILSTPATAKSSYLKNLIRQNAIGVKIANIGCPELENLVEEGQINSPEIKTLLRKYLQNVARSKPDYIVLGCTHYPFLKTTIKRLSPFRAKLIDSGKAIARRVKYLLRTSGTENGHRASTVYFTTGDPIKFSEAASRLLKTRVGAKKLKI